MATCPIDSSNWIAGKVMEFLGTRSLVRFSCCNNHIRSFLPTEVRRRKVMFSRNQEKVKVLLDEEPTRRATILQAHSIYMNSRRLIDDELNWLDKYMVAPGMLDSDDDEDEGPNAVPVDPLFAEERRRLTCDPEAWPPKHPDFYMLPLCFYIPPQGELALPQDDNLAAAMNRKVLWLWGAEDHMGFFYETEGFNSYYNDPKHPFRKFEASSAQFYYGCLHDTIHEIVGNNVVDSFRVAARTLAWKTPNSKDCLWYVLHHADHCEEQEE